MQNILIPIGISFHAQKNFECTIALSELLNSNLFVVDFCPIQIKLNQISYIKGRLEKENKSLIQLIIKKLKSLRKLVKVVKSFADLFGTKKKWIKNKVRFNYGISLR